MNNDLISREALKKAIKPLIEDGRIYDILSYIDNAPTVDFLINMKDLTAEQKQHFFNVWRNASFKIINERPQYDEGYADGYADGYSDGSTGKLLRLMEMHREEKQKGGAE